MAKPPIQARLMIFIQGEGYRCERLPVDKAVGSLAWRVAKHSQKVPYDIVVTPRGPVCDCPAGLQNILCKHIIALREVWLLPRGK